MSRLEVDGLKGSARSVEEEGKEKGGGEWKEVEGVAVGCGMEKGLSLIHI